MSRARFKGSSEDLADGIADVVEPLGRSWCGYLEQDASSKVDPLKIREHHSLLAALHRLQSNMSFTQGQIHAAAGHLYERFKDLPAWKMSDEHIESYQAAMCKRVRNLCRAVAQGQLKNPNCSWVRSLPWSEAAPAPAHPDGTGTDSQQSVVEQGYIFGWDSILLTAWRLPQKRKRYLSKVADKQLCDRIDFEEDGPDSAPVTAHWHDGCTWIISDITKGDLKAMRDSGSAAAPLWEAVHSISNNALQIRARKDRNPLLILLEQKRQVCQIRTNVMKQGEAQALAILTEVAEKYAKNEIQKEMLTRERNTIMQREGLESVRPVGQAKPRQRKAAIPKPEAAPIPEKDVETDVDNSTVLASAVDDEIAIESPPMEGLFTRSLGFTS